MRFKFPKFCRFIIIVGIVAIITIVASLPVRIALTHFQNPQPEAIFMLGGGIQREHFTAEFAQQHPELPVWISAGSSRIRKIFAEANLDSNRIHYDDRATDTVTNFTTMVEPFQKNDIHHVYLITSDFHMRRSSAIATIVFGSQGIVFTPREVSSSKEPEEISRIIRDIGRCLLWLVTGRTGASYNPRLSHDSPLLSFSCRSSCAVITSSPLPNDHKAAAASARVTGF